MSVRNKDTKYLFTYTLKITYIFSLFIYNLETIESYNNILYFSSTYKYETRGNIEKTIVQKLHVRKINLFQIY